MSLKDFVNLLTSNDAYNLSELFLVKPENVYCIKPYPNKIYKETHDFYNSLGPKDAFDKEKFLKDNGNIILLDDFYYKIDFVLASTLRGCLATKNYRVILEPL
jgi:hypothetical protein